MTLPPHTRSNAPLIALLAVLALSNPRAAHGEGSVTYRYEDYRESGGRVSVRTDGVLIEQQIGQSMKVRAGGVIDALAGATPTGQPAPEGSEQVPLGTMRERRKAWFVDLSRQFPRVQVSVGAANSRESDYVSTAVSINTLTDFNQKNTTVLLGAAANFDDVRVFHQLAPERKRTRDVILGVAQLLDPDTSLSVNLSWGRSTGYLSDPYKLVEKTVEIVPDVVLPLTFPENRPADREKWILRALLNRSFLDGDAALEAAYRYYADSFGTDAHSIEFAWFQRLAGTLTLRPSLRLYRQAAADFYIYRLDDTAVVPRAGPPSTTGPFYSSDYRLSEFDSATVGLKLTWNPVAWLQFDAGFDHYRMRGRDGITPQSAYVSADNLVLGVKLTW